LKSLKIISSKIWLKESKTDVFHLAILIRDKQFHLNVFKRVCPLALASPQSLGSISPTFYELLLCVQIPKAQKIQSSHQLFFAHLGSVQVKAAHKNVGEIDTWSYGANSTKVNVVKIFLECEYSKKIKYF